MIPTTAPDDAGTTGDTLPPTLVVVPWVDDHLGDTGFDPRSTYVERFWLAILGPSTTLLLRRLARGLEDHPAGFRIDLADTARALGLGESTSRSSMVVRTIERACQFGLAQRIGVDRLAVRRFIPPLTPRQLRRLPASVQRAHERFVADAQNAAHRASLGGDAA